MVILNITQQFLACFSIFPVLFWLPVSNTSVLKTVFASGENLYSSDECTCKALTTNAHHTQLLLYHRLLNFDYLCITVEEHISNPALDCHPH